MFVVIEEKIQGFLLGKFVLNHNVIHEDDLRPSQKVLFSGTRFECLDYLENTLGVWDYDPIDYYPDNDDDECFSDSLGITLVPVGLCIHY